MIYLILQTRTAVITRVNSAILDGIHNDDISEVSLNLQVLQPALFNEWFGLWARYVNPRPSWSHPLMYTLYYQLLPQKDAREPIAQPPPDPFPSWRSQLQKLPLGATLSSLS